MPSTNTTTNASTTESTTTPNRPKRQLSPKALEANRRNAQKSTGPRTEAGKSKSRLNAGRHHITAQTLILPPEEYKACEAFCQPLVDNFHPEGPEELQLARAIAENYWRLNQARAAVTNRIALTAGYRNPEPMAAAHPQVEYAAHVANTFAEDANALRLISLYEQRTLNQLRNLKRELETAQSLRQQKRAAALEEAKAVYEATRAQGQAWNPEAESGNNGFVFSASFLAGQIARDKLLNRTRTLQNNRLQRHPATFRAA